MKSFTLLTVMLVLQLSLTALAQDKDKETKKKELYNSNSKLIVTPRPDPDPGASKVMVTPKEPVPNRTQTPANFNSMKEARRQMRRYRRYNERERLLGEIRPACSHELADRENFHPNHYCSEMATWEAEYRQKYGHSYKEPERLTPYPVSEDRPFSSGKD